MSIKNLERRGCEGAKGINEQYPVVNEPCFARTGHMHMRPSAHPIITSSLPRLTLSNQSMIVDRL